MSIDVNTDFHNQRTALMAGAGARRTSTGTYVATVGYDQGEVIGRDGLDTTRGEAALYTSTPAWHGLGTVIPGGVSDIDTVLRLAQIDYTVTKRPAQYRLPHGEYRTARDQFVTIREDSGDALGIVGRRYQPFQQHQVFAFLTELVGTREVIFESAGALRGGRRVFVTMQIPEAVTIDRGGLDDQIVLFIVAINSHDGTSQAQVVVTPWRVVCGNTERFSIRDAAHRWGIRHTVGGLDQLAEARRTLGLTLNYAATFEAEETALARTDMEIDAFHRLISDLWPVDDDATDRTRAGAARRTDRLDAMFRTETGRAGRTAYAAERTITDYLDHVAPRRPGRTMTEEIARATAALEGTDDDLKSKAHQRLMLLRR
ncbi:DUF932 domain-containing protein [Streptomyces sp. CAU 1734]|uniref:DUF932 domain-containing protein n=1 Tax=Streptomyces sp. CAU 1734 TaxID=3140360 RepID=UPI00326040A9